MSRTTSMSNITYVRGDAELIEEFIVQADVVDTTRHHYRVKLTEFLAWLNHPNTIGAEPARSLLEVRRANVARFMAYLLSGDRTSTVQWS